ncbi:MAG: universal stress protein [Jatrophihabitantaceae bacterium]
MSVQESIVEQGRIVVGVDGSTQSRHALRWGAYLAETMGCTLEAIGAWHVPAVYGWGDAGWAGAAGQFNLDELTRKVLTDTVTEVFGDRRPAGLTMRIGQGDAARVLIDASREASMLVLGNRGHGGFTDLLLGSVSAACSRHANCPVLIVHGDGLPPAAAVSAAEVRDVAPVG